MVTFLNVTEKNFTETNQTRHGLQQENYVIKVMQSYLPRGAVCSLATCITQNLVDRMQTGDEKAGEKASDAWGPGKK